MAQQSVTTGQWYIMYLFHNSQYGHPLTESRKRQLGEDVHYLVKLKECYSSVVDWDFEPGFPVCDETVSLLKALAW